MSRPTRGEIDLALWSALVGDRVMPLQLSPEDWQDYLKVLREEARGYWHQLTGRLYERLESAQGVKWGDLVERERKNNEGEKYAVLDCIGDITGLPFHPYAALADGTVGAS